MKRLIKGQLVIWVYKENILGIMLSAFLFGGVVACSDEQATEKQLTDESGLPEYPIPDRTTIVAFPGAYGAGKYTTGGAGGTVYIVTSLADDGVVGTLRHAIQQKGRRTIVFAVGGVIELQKQLVITNDDITIAGQTAPGKGICLKDNTLRVNANNVIIRFLRCRMGDEKRIEDDAMNGYQNNYPGKQNIIIDHCSMSWSTDECASFYGNTNFTMQWCILSESLWHSIHEKEAHGYGGIWGGSPATFHHNLLAHHSNRTPRLCGSRYSNRADVEKVDLCNNVIYNWTNEGAYGAQGGYYNIMNNYYKLGPASAKDKTHARFFTAYIDDGKNAQDAGVFGYFYVNGNIMDNTCVDLSGEQQKEIASANANNTSSTAFKVKNDERTSSDLLLDMRIDILSDYSFMQSATDAYETVLAYAGAWTCGWKDNKYIIPERDKIDRRIVSETANGTYSTNASKGGGYGTAVVTATAADGSGVSASCIVQVIRPVTDIKLSKSKITLYVGDVFHLVATVEPADASVKKLEWTSSDPTVAKVYDDGDVEAVGVGRCKVYATSTDGNNVVAECTIIVKQIVSATSVTINSHEILMLTGKVRTLTARLFPINSTETVKWVSSDTSVVVVDSNGQITTVGPGSCQVTAYTTYGTIQDTCMVYSMAISKSSTTLEQYDTFNLYVDGAPSTAAVSWRSSNPRIATVTQRGIVTARMPGECTITATVDGKTVTCNVIVRSIDPGKFINKTNEKP